MTGRDCRTAEDIRTWLEARDRGGEDPERDYLLKHGRAMDPSPLPDKRWRRTTGRAVPKIACTINSQKAALAREDWRYVEGYAVRRNDPFGVQFHCWNLDPTGRVIDTTWDDEGIAYFGAVVPPEAMGRQIVEVGGFVPVLRLMRQEVGR